MSEEQEQVIVATVAKKKTFVEPSLEGELADDAVIAKEYLDERLADEEATTNYMDQVGCFIPDTKTVKSVTEEMGTKYLEKFKTYKEIQTKLDPDLLSSSKLGIFSGPARTKVSNQQKVCADAILSADMLKLDHEVTSTLSDVLPKGAVSIPAVLLTDAESSVSGGARIWRYLHGTDSCKLVAIVPLTNCILSFVPHGKDMQAKWDEMTFGGTATKETHPKHHILPLSFRRKIDALDVEEDEEEGTESRDIIYQVALQPGSIFVTHRGMPVCIEGMPDEEDPEGPVPPFMVKTVAFEVPSKGSKRRNLLEQAIESGYFTAGQLHENMYYKTLPILKEGPPDPQDESVFCMPRATKEEVPWLFERKKKAAPKKVGGGTPKKIVAKPPPSPPSSPAGQGEGGDESSSAPPQGGQGQKKAKKKGNDANKDRFSSAKARHQTLKDMISQLNSLAWKQSHSENADEKERAAEQALAEGTLKANVLRKYEDALNTLESKVKEAEKGQEELSRIQQNLEEIERILQEVDSILLPELKMEKNSHTRRKATLDGFKNIKEELYKYDKKISEQVEQCRDLLQKTREKVQKKNSGPAGPPGDMPDLPTVDEDALSPYIVVGKKEIKQYLLSGKEQKDKLADAAKAHDNNHARELLKKLNAQHEEKVLELGTLIKSGGDPKEMKMELSKHFAYSTALDSCIELLNSHADAMKQAKKKRARPTGGDKITCPECEAEDVANFANSGHCAVCFAELIVQKRHNKIDDRVCNLEKLAEREEEELEGVEGPMQEKWKLIDEAPDAQKDSMYETYTKAAEAFLERPNKRTWEIFSKLYEEMDTLLPESDDMDEDDDEGEYDEYDEEEEDEDEDSSSKTRKKRKGEHEGILSLRNLPSDEEEASFSDSDDEREYGTKSRKRDRSSSAKGGASENTLADRALKTMKAIRVLPVWEKIVNRYGDADKHALLDAYLDELHTDTKYTYSVKVKSVREEEADLPPSSYHTHFLDQNKAMEIKQTLTVPGETRAIVSKHEVKF